MFRFRFDLKWKGSCRRAEKVSQEERASAEGLHGLNLREKNRNAGRWSSIKNVVYRERTDIKE